jgi:hypothetical protein
MGDLSQRNKARTIKIEEKPERYSMWSSYVLKSIRASKVRRLRTASHRHKTRP